MLAALRFYRKPHRYVTGPAREGLMHSGIERPRPQLAPTFYFQDQPMVDSTPIIARLEQELSVGRSLVPPDDAMAFLSRLIEDYADEWCTKMMYHYRWDLDRDQEKASMFLMLSSNPAIPPAALKQRSQFIRDRQVGRMDFVGANETTKPVIEADYVRLITLLDLHLESGKEFLFGHRPSQADYGLFGQLSQLHRVENTSREQLEALSVRVTGWLSFMTDLSGRPVLDEHWDTELAPTTKALLQELGRHYAPFLVANAESLGRGAY